MSGADVVLGLVALWLVLVGFVVREMLAANRWRDLTDVLDRIADLLALDEADDDPPPRRPPPH